MQKIEESKKQHALPLMAHTEWLPGMTGTFSIMHAPAKGSANLATQFLEFMGGSKLTTCLLKLFNS